MMAVIFYQLTIIVSLLVYATHSSFLLSSTYVQRKANPERKWLLMLWSVSIMQILLGTGIRSTVEKIWEKFPLLNAGDLLSRVGPVSYIHTFLGIFLAIGMIILGHKILKINRLSTVSTQSVWLLNTLIAIQIIIGVNLHLLELPPILQVFHLWIASLFIGVLLILYTDLKYEQVENE